VSEYIQNVIRQVDVATGAVTTIAGLAGTPGSTNGIGSAARFENPAGLALNSDNTLYVADSGNCTIRSIDLATDTVSLLSGTPGTCAFANGANPTFDTPSGIALYNGYIYVAERGGVSQIMLFGTATLAGGATYGYHDGVGTAAGFDGLNQIVSDGAGNLYVADQGNKAVREINIASMQVTTIAGGSINGVGDLAFYEMQGVAIVNGTVWASDATNTIREVGAPVSAIVGLPAHPGNADASFPLATFRSPKCLALDSEGHAYVADVGNYGIRTLDLTASSSSALAGGQHAGASDGTGANAELQLPQGMAFDASVGAILFADASNNAVRETSLPGGAVTTPFSNITDPMSGLVNGIGKSSEFYYPNDVVLVNGVLYVADVDNEVIRAIDVATAATSTFAGGAAGTSEIDGVGAAARFNAPSYITSDGTSLYVGDDSTIRKIDIATAAVTTIAGQAGQAAVTADGLGSAARFVVIGPIEWDGASSLYILDSQTVRRLYLPTGAVNTFAGIPYYDGVRLGSVTGAQLGYPAGIALPSPGVMLLSTSEENSILQLVQQ
jgi:hypothetical protein